MNYGIRVSVYLASSTITLNVYNCSLSRISTNAGGRGISLVNGAGAITYDIKNTIAVGTTTDFAISGAGTRIDAGSSHNLSSDATAPGTSGLINQTAADVFVNAASDLHLKAGSPAIGAGNKVLDFDALGNPRGTPDDMGALTTYTIVVVVDGYRLYRGRGGLANVDFSTPIGTAGVDAGGVTLTALGHDPAARYTYVVRAVRRNALQQWVETPDFSCTAQIETDDQGQWVADRPWGLGKVWAQPAAAGELHVGWEFQTPYGAAAPAGFAVYSGPASGAVSTRRLWQPYTRDGLYLAALDLPDGTHWITVTVCSGGGVESWPSPPAGPFVVAGTPVVQLAIRVEETQ
ncbi:MAG: hypothetical protein ABFD92_16890 [Planctomycetaceae bacterium]|nr:hypothetical protein [Planctomycetaceae bacterium]